MALASDAGHARIQRQSATSTNVDFASGRAISRFYPGESMLLEKSK
jgi:hypothetical protein